MNTTGEIKEEDDDFNPSLNALPFGRFRDGLLALEEGKKLVNLDCAVPDDHSARVLAYYIALDSNTHTLSVRFNNFTDAGARYIAEALAKNTHLEVLYFFNTELSHPNMLKEIEENWKAQGCGHTNQNRLFTHFRKFRR
ncbi:unnamed protein product [Heterosigma akashiwo]